MHHPAPPVGRNEPCPCGSGRKYKVCCEKATPAAGSRWSSPHAIIAFIALFAIAGYVVVTAKTEKPSQTVLPVSTTLPITSPLSTTPQPTAVDASGNPVPIQAQPLTPGPQPPGPVPPGKVWSEEHGHWHDAPQAGATTNPLTPMDLSGTAAPIQMQPATPGPQPPGPAPEGKVWSEEHGHWHDINPPAATANPLTPMDPSGNPAPVQIQPATPGPQPPGPAPEGKVWSEEHGHWHDIAPQGTNPPPGN